MRYKFIILFLFISFIGKAQVYQLMPQYGYDAKRMNFDSTIQIPTFCGVPKLGSNVTKKGALAFDSCNNRFYFFNPKFQSWDTIKSANSALFVKYTDTSSLVAPYLRKGDTIFLSQRIDQRVKYSDTAAMLLPYLRKIDTTNKWVSSVTKLNDSTIRVVKDGTTTDIAISAVSSATRLITQVWNNTGATILRGSVVYISGRHSSNLPTIALAEGNNEANSYKTFALVDGDIPDNSSGFVIQAGKITGLNLPTSSYTDGDILYLSPTVAGGYTTTKPLAPNHIVKLGSVTRAHPTQASIEIKIENGWQLDELSDVQIAAVPADSTLLQFSRVDSLWHDVSPLTAMGNRFVKTTDSAAMLSPYLRSNVATATYATIAQNNLKLNISDTANMLLPYLRKIDTTNRFITSVFRKTASDSVFFVRGGTNNFAFKDSTGGGNIYNTDGTLTANRTLSVNNNSLTFRGSATASSGISTPYRFSPTLTAAANNDTLVALDINPTFSSGAFTNINNYALRINGNSYTTGNSYLNSLNTYIQGASDGRINFYTGGVIRTSLNSDGALIHAANNNSTAFSISQNGTSGNFFQVGNSLGDLFIIQKNGNIGINQNTDAGYKLDVNGTTRIRANTLIANTANTNNELQLQCSGLNRTNVIRFLNTDGTTQGGLVSTGSSFNYGTYRANQSSLFGTTGGVGLRTNNGSTAHITFYAGNADGDFSPAQMQMFAPTGNVQLQNGGTYTDIASARLAVNSTTQGFLQPRMSNFEMNAISTPATGLSVFNTTDSAVYIRRGTGAGWQQLANEIVNTASLNFPSTNAQNSSDLTITLTGAVDGDAVVLGVPNAAVNANSCYTAWVSAANTVTVRFNNYSSGAIDPAQATFKVTIIK